MRRHLLVRGPAAAAAVVWLLIAGAGPAAAASPIANAEAVFAGGSTHVYVDLAAERRGDIDVTAANSAVGSNPIYVAVLPAFSAAEADNQPAAVAGVLLRALRSSGLRSGAVLAVVGTGVYAAGSFPGLDSSVLSQLATRLSAADGANLTRLAGDFSVQTLRAVAAAAPVTAAPTPPPGSTGSVVGQGSAGTSGSPGGSGAYVLVAALAGVLVVALVVFGRVPLQRRALVRGRRREVAALLADLDAQLPGLTGPAAADATERSAAARTALSGARGDRDRRLWQARRAAVEGLIAAHEARRAAGLATTGQPPELERPAPGIPVLDAETVVQIGGQPVRAAGAYRPGLAHWFAGGYAAARSGEDPEVIPGGWYETAFWERAPSR